MFMFVASTDPTRASQPGRQASRAGRLLGLVRRLIDYGKELACSLRQHGAAALGFPANRFGTDDLALILAHITRGLQLAAALETKIADSAARLDAEPKSRSAPAQRTPRSTNSAAQPAEGADPRLAAIPTPEQIAAEVRRRPIGAVLADICRDLGILPSNPLWRELQWAIIRYCGNYARLVMDTLDRVVPLSVPITATALPVSPRPP